jgi:glycosyltransferase involved in cell wall biosynthesis
MTPTARVQIGLPVYNGAASVGRALQTLLAQTFADIEIIVSDNASTDGTAAILEGFARGDPRVRLHRQPANIGAHANFGFVLARATSPYFMWAAADDWWAPDFILRNLEFLDAHPDYVSSISQVLFDGTDERLRLRMGTFALTGDVARNLRDFLWRPQFNSRFYALHRTESIRKAWIDQTFWAGDWAIVVNLLRQGRFHELPQVLMNRGSRGASSDWLRAMRSWKLGQLDQWLPMLALTRFCVALPEVRRRPSLLLPLIYWNVRGSLQMAALRLRALARR